MPANLDFTIRGKGGHAASPHLCIDPILISSHLVVALQQIISRRKNPQYPSVLSITAFNGGTTTNVIPNEVKLMGTFRAMDETWRFEAHELIRHTAGQIVSGLGGTLDLHIDVGYPAVYNNEALTQHRLGVRNTEKGIIADVHTPNFNIDENAIETGIGIMAWLGISG